MPKNWQVASKLPEEMVAVCSGYSPLLLQLLFNRGLKSITEIEDFFNDSVFPDDYSKKYDPFLFKDMGAAVETIINHLKAGQKILVYGDYDADGVTATVILYETLKLLKAEVSFYLPDRVGEGYGLNQKAVEQFIADGYKLIITVDTGTRNPDEIAYAKKQGIEVIVTDHHTLPDDPNLIPPCLLINTSNENDNYPFKFLAGVGVSFKLIEALLSRANLDDSQKKLILDRNLDLVAVGTVSDMVKLIGENRLLVKRGLEVLNNTKRLGLKELIKAAKIGLNGQRLDSWNIGFQLGPRLNAASRLEHANTALELLITKDQSEAERLAADLNQKNIDRQKITEEMMIRVEARIDKQNIPEIIIGLCEIEESSWNEGVIGLVAGRLSEKYYRPALVITRTADGFKGSGRSIAEFNLMAAMEETADYLDKFGGHPMACGFSVFDQEKLDKFVEKMKIIAKEKLVGLELKPKLSIDAELKMADINLGMLEQIEKLAPYGQANPQPKFVSYGVLVNEIVNMGTNSQHVKIRLTDSENRTKSFWAIAFGKSEAYSHLQVGDIVDLVYYLEINNFNGRREGQMKIIDLIKK